MKKLLCAALAVLYLGMPVAHASEISEAEEWIAEQGVDEEFIALAPDELLLLIHEQNRDADEILVNIDGQAGLESGANNIAMLGDCEDLTMRLLTVVQSNDDGVVERANVYMLFS